MSIDTAAKPEFCQSDIYHFEQGGWESETAYCNFFEQHIDLALTDINFDDVNIDYGILREAVYQISRSRRNQISSIENAYAFYRGIARRIITKERLKTNRSMRSYFYETFGISNRHKDKDLLDSVLKKERTHLVYEEIIKLGEVDRQILFLRYYEDRSFSQIAKEINMPLSTVHDHVNAILAKLSKSKPLRSLYLNGACPFILQSIFEYGNVGTQGVGAASSKGILSVLSNGLKWFLSLIGLIFTAMLWLTSCMVLGTKGMAEFGRSTQGIKLRAAFIKYCFIGYALVMFYPVIHDTCRVYIPLMLIDIWPKEACRSVVLNIVNILSLVLFISYIVCVRIRYRRLQDSKDLQETSSDEIAKVKLKLRRFVNIVSVLIGFNVVFFCFHYLLGLYTVPLNSVKSLFEHNTWDSLVPGLICFGGYHLFSWRVFLKLVSETDAECSPEFSAKCKRNGVRLLTAAGMVFTLTVPLVGMVISESKNLVNGIMFASFLTSWFILIRWNKDRQKIFPVLLMSIMQWCLLRLIATVLGW